VFRDLGIAFGAALAMIYVILVAQTGSFTIPLVVMLALPITLDPIFAGLGWSLIFGLVASTLFTLFVIPISYRLLRR
jgi:multidrug efflux pump subunit AcrB